MYHDIGMDCPICGGEMEADYGRDKDVRCKKHSIYTDSDCEFTLTVAQVKELYMEFFG